MNINDFGSSLPRRIEPDSIRVSPASSVDARSGSRLEWPSTPPAVADVPTRTPIESLVRQMREGPEVRQEVVAEVHMRMKDGYYLDRNMAELTAGALLGISQVGD